MENYALRMRGSYADIEAIDSKLIEEWNSLITSEETRDEFVRFVLFLGVPVYV